MALTIDVGDRFPDVTLHDHDGTARTVSEVAHGQPLFLAFFLLRFASASCCACCRAAFSFCLSSLSCFQPPSEIGLVRT